MGMISLNSLNFKCGPGNVLNKNDFVGISNFSRLRNKYNFLIFTDSKGIISDYESVWTEKLVELLINKGDSFLLVTRPKEMTIFFSLLNFISYNKIKYDFLITNVGFVDTTPKKLEFIDDIFVQNPFLNINLEKKPIYNYLLNSGEITTLYNVNYDLVVSQIGKTLIKHFKKAYFIGTFEFSSNIKIKRKRPIEFFKQLKEANIFIKSVSNQSEHFIYIDVNIGQFENQADLSYDAVHFTQLGHDLVFQSIKTKLNCN